MWVSRDSRSTAVQSHKEIHPKCFKTICSTCFNCFLGSAKIRDFKTIQVMGDEYLLVTMETKSLLSTPIIRGLESLNSWIKDPRTDCLHHCSPHCIWHSGEVHLSKDFFCFTLDTKGHQWRADKSPVLRSTHHPITLQCVMSPTLLSSIDGTNATIRERLVFNSGSRKYLIGILWMLLMFF